jgi:hypothetical protein
MSYMHFTRILPYSLCKGQTATNKDKSNYYVTFIDKNNNSFTELNKKMTIKEIEKENIVLNSTSKKETKEDDANKQINSKNNVHPSTAKNINYSLLNPKIDNELDIEYCNGEGSIEKQSYEEFIIKKQRTNKQFGDKNLNKKRERSKDDQVFNSYMEMKQKTEIDSFNPSSSTDDFNSNGIQTTKNNNTGEHRDFNMHFNPSQNSNNIERTVIQTNRSLDKTGSSLSENNAKEEKDFSSYNPSQTLKVFNNLFESITEHNSFLDWENHSKPIDSIDLEYQKFNFDSSSLHFSVDSRNDDSDT